MKREVDAVLLAQCRETLLAVWKTVSEAELDPAVASSLRFRRELATLVEQAEARAGLVAEAGGDPALVTRALAYIGECLVPVGPEDMDVTWIQTNLDTLVILACHQVYGFPMPRDEFHDDLAGGIEEVIAYLADDEDDDDELTDYGGDEPDPTTPPTVDQHVPSRPPTFRRRIR